MYHQLPEAWARQPAWTVLDADFQHGQHFQAIWLAWQRDAQRPRMLHYVAVAEALPPGLTASNADAVDTALQPNGWHAFAQQCQKLEHGFHRLLLDGGQV